MTIREQIRKIDQRLLELRLEYPLAKPNRQKFIKSGADLFKKKRASLLIQLENE